MNPVKIVMIMSGMQSHSVLDSEKPNTNIYSTNNIVKPPSYSGIGAGPYPRNDLAGKLKFTGYSTFSGGASDSIYFTSSVPTMVSSDMLSQILNREKPKQ
jgi:hypothetical protein